jgi:uncharacterized protein (TIGR02453 family)
MPARSQAYFAPGAFTFLRALARNNTRDWFQAHKQQYEEQLRGPCLRLIADLAAPLARVSPVLVADPRPIGGSLFRIHRDTRFARDKSPYKTYAGMSFFHRATRPTARGGTGSADMGRLDAPVLYLHLEPGASFVGGGVWHPQPPTLKRVRDFMLDNPRSWKAATRQKAFSAHFELAGETLARPPRGYPAEHELIDDLKRKDVVATATLTDAQVLRTDFARLVMERFRRMRPMIEWLCTSLDLEF